MTGPVAVIEDGKNPSYIRELIARYLGETEVLNGNLEEKAGIESVDKLKEVTIFFIDADFIGKTGFDTLNYTVIDNHLRKFKEKKFYFFSDVATENFQRFTELFRYSNAEFINVRNVSDENLTLFFSQFQQKRIWGIPPAETAVQAALPEKDAADEKTGKKGKKKKGNSYKGFQKTVRRVDEMFTKENRGVILDKKTYMLEIYKIAAVLWAGRKKKRRGARDD